MPDIEYYTSEKAIWDNIQKWVAAGVSTLYEAWARRGKIDPFIVAWPSESILDDSGIPLDGACMYELPEDRATWSNTIRHFTQKTKAYALMLAEQREDVVRITLESHHGTRSWTLPIRRSGDLRTLGDVVVQDNEHRIGLLWDSRSIN